ncbi:MAG: primase C-terminal domain-containing protein [Coriobacteriales bacterium]|jgi:P4 family phage/plasmid primase-like protien|nr:primase C-terminal domain-containing protein [Coriobacteriales bacterium]
MMTNSNRLFNVATAKSCKDTQLIQGSYLWDDFAASLSEPRRGGTKDGGGYVAGAFSENRRNKKNIISRSMLTLDADHAEPNLWDTFRASFKVAAVLHSTWSHTPVTPRYRLIIPLTRDVEPSEYEALADAIMSLLGVEQFDEGSRQPERLMFAPACPESADFVYRRSDGDFLKPDEIFAASSPTPSAKAVKKPSASSDGTIPEGKRNEVMFRQASSDRSKGRPLPAALAAAKITNSEQCKPPLSEGEVETIVNSVYARYNEGTTAQEAKFIDHGLLDLLGTLHPEISNCYRNSELGWGRLLADVFKERARYVPERSSWFVFDGCRWCHDRGGLMVAELCKSLADALLVYATHIPDEQRGDLLKGWIKWQSRRTREIIVKDAASVYPKPLLEFDANPLLLNLTNGTYDLDTLKFREHRAEDFITRIANVAFDPNAECRRWLQFVIEVADGNCDLTDFIQRSLGYSVGGDIREHCLFVFYGPSTRNGKSTLCETLLNVLGEYAVGADPELLGIGRKTDGGLRASPDLARLAGARFVNLSEPGISLRFNEAKVKTWTGGDSLQARFLNENLFEFKPEFHLFINTNHLPTVRDTTLLSSGRVLVAPFTRHFTEVERDTTLRDQFSTEEAKSAILNWLLQGWEDYRDIGLCPPDAVTNAVAGYREESDLISQFGAECLIEDINAQVRTSEVYAVYKHWAERSGYRYENTKVFRNLLTRIGTVARKRPDAQHSETTMLIGFKLSDEGRLFDA